MKKYEMGKNSTSLMRLTAAEEQQNVRIEMARAAHIKWKNGKQLTQKEVECLEMYADIVI